MKKYVKNPCGRTWAEVRLDRIRQNMEAMRAAVPAGVGLCGVVKADAYGHGAPPVAKAIDAYVELYAVATVEEGISLRRHGIVKPVLVLGVTPPDRYPDLLKHGIMPSVFTMEQARELSARAEWLGQPAQVHLAVDTGMGRIGIQAWSAEAGAGEEEQVSEAGVALAADIASLPMLAVDGIFTHFATADEADKAFTKLQLARFRRFVGALEARDVRIPRRHCANSACILEGMGTDWDLMRAGISIYGVYPSDEVSRTRVALAPAMELKAAVSHVKTVEPGATVSYGASFRAQRRMEIATIPAGYADGYPRTLSGKAEVLIHGRRCPVLGRVCMDQFMVDVSGLGAAPGDTATLLGQDGTDRITLDDFARWGGCFSYEVLCGIGKRVPRVYLDGGEIVGVYDASSALYEDFL